MNKIIYYVASSLDGYIAGKDEDISSFINEGSGVDKYMTDLQTFNTVIMGRRTYEFGYKYGLEPGQPAYPHMEHFIFSNSLQIENLADTVHIESLSLNRVQEIKKSSKTDIYLCGGGQCAGWLLENDLIDQVKIKLNPIILGEGTRLFGDSQAKAMMTLIESATYDNGLQILTISLQ